jgi:hypothetical protein
MKGLDAAGSHARWKILDGGFHGFELVCPNAPISKSAKAFLMDCFAEAARTCFAPQPPARA